MAHIPAEPIAVVGCGFRFPGNANTPSKLWELLRSPRDLLSPIPDDRFSTQGFYHPNDYYHGHCNVKESYLLSGEGVHRQFDAGFFGIMPVEANVMDPQMRLLLEVVYEALEAGGQTIESLRGSDTAVYAGLMMGDYEKLMQRDEDALGTYHVTGTARSLISNRLSYFFDWRGPSMTIDTACSSSLVAVHQAIQQLRSGQSRVAVATGANLILDPQYYVTESKLHMLSPENRSRMWDAGANGYARGEGIAAVILKTLRAAEADGDFIECVIRETGTSQDGRTKGITMPNSVAQAQLIRACYSRAGLNLADIADRPQYFEAHGTGTPAGDPVEAEAISLSLFPIENAVLRVGSIKTVMGHSEGAAGLAGLIKASLALKNAQIPPNLLFNHLNPDVAPFYKNMHIPTTAEPWPEQPSGTPRRASVNSFGFGGTNAHAILESYTPPQRPPHSAEKPTVFVPFVFSAAAEVSLVSYLASFIGWLQDNGTTASLRDLAFTLYARRSRFAIATAVAASSTQDLRDKIESMLQIARRDGKLIGTKLSTPQNQSSCPRLLGVFTGQGAQWAGMGAALVVSSPAAREVIQMLEARLARLPPPDRPSWSLMEELQNAKSSRLNEAGISQPLCTAVQIMQIDLLYSAGVHFAAVVGHSSGEIAAAYAAGMISAEDAICIAYYRGIKCSLAQGKDGQRGAMIAVGSSYDDILALCEEPELIGRVCIAAVNSSASVTVSGDEGAIEEAQIVLEDEKKFVRLLKVDKAYHSHHMIPCSEPYLRSLTALGIRAHPGDGCSWYSSVFDGENMEDHQSLLGGVYWERNMAKPVLFMQAIQNACAVEGPFDAAIEVGPHPALMGPTLQTFTDVYGQSIPYFGLSRRGENAVESFADTLGCIWTHFGRDAVEIDAFDRFASGNTPAQLITGLPTYAWNHAVEYWHESRLARAVRTRSDAVHELLGHLTPDSTRQEMRWRHLLRPQEVPWLKCHRLQNQTVFPAAGYVVAAAEASNALCKGTAASLIEILNLDIHKALTFNNDDSSIETVSSLSDITWGSSNKAIEAQFKYYAAGSDRDSLDLLASGRVRVVLGSHRTDYLPTRNPRQPNLIKVDAIDFYTQLEKDEYEYSGPFAVLHGIERKFGAARGLISIEEETNMLIHPATLDAAFQSLLLAYSFPGDGRLWSMHIPRTIRRVRFVPQLCLDAKAQGKPLTFETQQPFESSMLEGDIHIYPEGMQNAMVQTEGLVCVPFSGATPQQDVDMFSTTVWDVASPDAENLGCDGLSTLKERQFVTLLERVAFFYLRALNREVPMKHPTRTNGPLVSLYSYALHATSTDCATDSLTNTPGWIPAWQDDTYEDIQHLCEPFEHIVDVKLLRAIGENLVAIATGERQAIEIGMEENLLAQYYENAIGMSVYTQYLARAVKQVTHKDPHMHILEIGAGTGSATKRIFGEIGQCFASYTFTDISSGFFGAATATFADQAEKMTFKVLDISQSPQEQGFAEHSYDMIVASMVLHATPKLEQTMRNVRRLLKPGGHLIVLEGHDNHAFRVGAIFGAFPGWWLGADDGRLLSPCIDLAHWDELLRDSGFSGCDSVTPNLDPLVMPLTLFVSQAVDDRVAFLRDPLSSSPELLGSGTSPQNIILFGGNSLKTSRLIVQLKTILQPFYGSVKVARTLQAVSAEICGHTTVLSLLDLDESVFANITEEKWEALKMMLNTARVVLWVTHGRRADNPYANMMTGVFRACSREIPTLEAQLLDIEDVKKLGPRTLAEVLLRLQATSSWQRQDAPQMLLNPVEPELLLDKEGRYLIPRLLPNQEMNDRYNSSRRDVTSYKSMANLEGVSIELSDSGLYLREHAAPAPGAGCSIQIRTTHSVISAVRVAELGCMFLVMGRNDDTGEQVMALSTSNSSLVCPWSDLYILVNISIGSEAEFLTVLTMYMLVSSILQGLSEGDTVVVYKPTATFAAILSEEASAHTIDVLVLTDDQPAATEHSWVLIRPYTPQTVLCRNLPDNISAFVDFSTDRETDAVGESIRSQLSHYCKCDTLDTLYSVLAWSPLGAHINGIRDRLRSVVACTERLLSPVNRKKQQKISTVVLGDLPGRPKHLIPYSAIVDWNSSLLVPIRVQPVDCYPMFSESKTYWLAGLSGGLGLSLCEWMVRHGAKHIVISSRRPDIEASWLEEMTETGAVIKVASCDVTNRDQVLSLYNSICSNMPPIAGVAQGAMVLQDTAINDMKLETLSKVTTPKVKGSIHLNDLFPEDTLDFFIFFSSVSAVVGNPGQLNYAAANLFMASLAEQRRKRGLAASIINIGPILGAGYITQEGIASKTLNSKSTGYTAMSERDFHQLFAEAVRSSPSDSGCPMEITTGIRAVKPGQDGEERPGWARNPGFSHLILNHASAGQLNPNSRSRVPIKTQLSQAKSQSDVYDIIKTALVPKICSLFQLDVEKFTNADLATLRLDEMGIDSLLAVEIRGWFMKTLEVNIPVLKILNGAAVGELISIASVTIPASLVPNIHPDSAGPLMIDTIGSPAAASPSTTDNIESSSQATDSLALSDDTYYPHPSVLSDTVTCEDSDETSTLLKSLQLSFSQSMFWFVSAALEDKTSLNHSGSFRLSGNLRPRDLAEAVRAIGRQHEALRTCFLFEDGEPKQGIMETSLLRLEIGRLDDETEVDQTRLALQNHVFDLKRGETMRLVLFSVTEALHFLVIGANGLAMDGMSFQVFMKDLERHYLNVGLSPENTRQFSDYSQKQHDDYISGQYDISLRFWKKKYPDFPPPLPILPISRVVSRPDLAVYENERFDVRISTITRSQIQTTCRQHRATAFHFYLSVFRALLCLYTNSEAEDISIGVGDANRTQNEMMDSIGMFLNLLPLRFRTSNSATFAEILQDTRVNMYDALAHSSVPFQVLLNELDAPRAANCTPIFQCFIDYRLGQRETSAWADCQLEMLSFQASKTAYDIALDIIDDADGECLLMFQVRKDLYDERAVQLLARSYQLLAEAFATDPNAILSGPALFDPAAIEEASRFSRGPLYVSSWPETIVHRFEDVARTWPGEVATVSGDGTTTTTTTYAALSNSVITTAAALQAAGITPNSKVAVLQEPTATWVASMLAIMRIGAVYVPLDINTPWARLAAMVKDSQASAILVDETTEKQAQQLRYLGLIIMNATTPRGKHEVPILATAGGPAMILYTSGSTGTPKGIILKHEGLRNWIEPTTSLYSLGREVVLQQSSSNFDMSFTQIATGLCFGGSVYLLPRNLRGDALAISEVVASHGITYTCATPSEYLSWLRYGMKELAQNSKWKTAVSAGEPLSRSLLQKFKELGNDNLRLFNMYGPTEISLVATATEVQYMCDPKHMLAIDAGYTLPNYSVYVVDQHLNMVPPGVQGEIYIGGAGVAAGYLNNPSLTAERFVDDIFATDEYSARGWSKMHRTGDLGRWQADGSLLIEGRVTGDTQIKLRGLRMDLREIENTIVDAADESISEAVVSLHQGSLESPDLGFLVAHVVFGPQSTVEAADQGHFLRSLQAKLTLPQYMIPAFMIPMETLPRTSSSKLDRRAVAALPLPQGFEGNEGATQDAAGLKPIEIQLRNIWAEVIPSLTAATLRNVTRQTDFFHVGGTSLLLLGLQARVRMVFGVRLPLIQMFQSSTLGNMSQRVESSLEVRPRSHLLDWDTETAVPSYILRLLETKQAEGQGQGLVQSICPAGDHSKVVLLTGSTGFLGRALLAALVADPRVRMVHCLAVRNASSRHRAVVAEVFSTDQNKITIHEGDLNLPRLGLSELDAHSIFSAADLIIHNGADVSYLKGYATLRPANLESTKEIAALCLPRRIPFHYISTAGIGMFAAKALGSDHVFTAASAANYPPPADVSPVNGSGHGYTGMTATKWASERFLERVVSANGGPHWPVFIHRPSLIVRAGRANPGMDLVRNIRQYARCLHAVPVIRTADGEGRAPGALDLVTLDHVVRGVLEAAMKADQQAERVRFIHHLGGVKLPIGDLTSLILQDTVNESDGEVEDVKQLGGEESLNLTVLEELPVDEWARKAGKAGMDITIVALLETLANADDIVFPRYM
ncbi:hypothetical protein VMCG_04865 [Cytospora schulzeri]|uniref:Uncharacterized protein n=1 Tax=Cytospora schulzeri TaxID=448051 RepID=A0A423WN93_9PEZI|nr:hypothetical protein VMCG_04865 [Valsa malicola]